MTLTTLLTTAATMKASDLHIFVGKRPIVRVSGQLTELSDQPVLTNALAQELSFAVLSAHQKEVFTETRELDLSYEIEGIGRFRINMFWEKGNVGLVARLIPEVVPSMEEIHLPQIAFDFTKKKDGLILITGPAGSGKSTTLASMINGINMDRGENIITLEDPIEFLFHPQKSIIKQRQLGQDMLSFQESLKYVLRQDPNIIMVGEMRDLETIAATITLAETGHLVFATLHTYNAAQTISRIIDVFPPSQQQQIRLQLSTTLQGIVSQRLLTKAGGGRVAVREVLVNTPAISTLIRDNKIQQIQSMIQTGADEGMMTMDQSLREMYESGAITEEDARAYATNPESVFNGQVKESATKKSKRMPMYMF